MVLFKSAQPDVQVPENLTTWDWLFESKEHSPLYAGTDEPLGAFIDAASKERLDWAQVKAKSTALSAALIAQYGLQPGDTVSLFSGNSIWYPVCMFAVIRAGGRINGASPAYTVDEMEFALKVSRAKVVIATPASFARAAAAATRVGISPDHVLLANGGVDGVITIAELIESGMKLPSPAPYEIPPGKTSKAICGYLNFSSGTTGLPKAVMISHYNVIAQCYQMRQQLADPGLPKILAVMPLFHITGVWRFCHYPIFLNGEGIMLPAFSMPAMLEAISHFKLEEVNLVPPILLRLARDAVVDEYDLRSVKLWTSGAAPMSPEVVKALERRFPGTGFRNGYGATEAAVSAGQPPSHYDYKYGVSVGMVLPNTVAKIISPEGIELGYGQTGELLVKGPQVAMGYLDNAVATAESFETDGFYHTGDAAYFDEKEGLLYITDRIKEMIKVKGSQVPPAELEDLLLGNELVDDCAVIGVPDEYAGELPKAFVVLKSGASPTVEAGRALLEYVKERRVRYKWLAEVEFVDKIPKSPAGKLLRRVLREREQNRKQGTEERTSSDGTLSPRVVNSGREQES